MYDEKKLIKDERNKPESIFYCDYIKDGVDIVDLFSAMASIKVKTKRWSNIVLSSFLTLQEPTAGHCSTNVVKNIFPIMNSMGGWGKL